MPVKKALLETLATGCSHSEILDYASCVKCTGKMLERRKLMSKLGFKSFHQYMEWQRVHETIAKRVPLAKYNSK